jgi:hypothetical protein
VFLPAVYDSSCDCALGIVGIFSFSHFDGCMVVSRYDFNVNVYVPSIAVAPRRRVSDWSEGVCGVERQL